MRIDGSGNVGIGTTAPSSLLHLAANAPYITFEDKDNNQDWQLQATAWFALRDQTNNAERLRIDSSGNLQVSTGQFTVGTTATTGLQFINDGTFGTIHSANLVFRTVSTERMRIDNSGRLLINNTTSNQDHPLQVTASANSAHAIAINARASDDIGELTFFSNNRITRQGEIQYRNDQVNIRHRSGSIRFATGGTTERMRIDSSGRVLIGTTTYNNTIQGVQFNESGQAFLVATNNPPLQVNRLGGDGTVISIRNDSSQVGTISVSGSTTAYNESSDYRLKENVVDIIDGITRVKQLQPRRFNFIVNPDTTVDGFLAHEAQTVVPEAVTGTHNEVDDDGDPVMQGIDKSKLVPLLTAALKEAIAKIETLEAKVAALEAG
jgi:hypothetical protein